MDEGLRNKAQRIIEYCIEQVQPKAAVQRAMSGFLPLFNPAGKTVVIAVGKAAWSMAQAALCQLQTVGNVAGQVSGTVITKYGHSKGELPGLRIFEAGHPVPDAAGFAATAQVVAEVDSLTEQDQVLFLLSGGGSALFEQPLVAPEELQSVTAQLLACGADIVEINTVRKRLSGVKGGRFALHCAPAKVYSIVLSDIVGDPLDSIASGPAYPDATGCEQALKIAEKYRLQLSDTARKCLTVETPKTLENVTTVVTGSVRQLCAAACAQAEKLGYRPVLLTDSMTCQAREAGSFLASCARTYAGRGEKVALIAGGETVVVLTGKGLGGRNQELALAAADGIAGLSDTAVFSLGSDGTDGPTDAAGGYVDGNTAQLLAAKGIAIADVLQNNDAYHALQAVDGLIITGPTGTNVNDVSVVLTE